MSGKKPSPFSPSSWKKCDLCVLSIAGKIEFNENIYESNQLKKKKYVAFLKS